VLGWDNRMVVLKKVGCILLFSDMYYISRSMMVLAFISILVVLFALCMDYVVRPSMRKDNEVMEWEKKLDVFQKQFSNRIIPGYDDDMSPEPFGTTGYQSPNQAPYQAPSQLQPGVELHANINVSFNGNIAGNQDGNMDGQMDGQMDGPIDGPRDGHIDNFQQQPGSDEVDPSRVV